MRPRTLTSRDPRPRSQSPWLRAGALLAASALVLTACGGDKKDDADDPTEPQGTGEQSTMSRINPLTGKVLDELPRRPVLAFKIDNSGHGTQIGLSRADMVVEELVEGGITRLATFFYSKVPHRAGPMRSMRATDIGIVQPLEAVLVASGGAPVTVRRVREAGIRTVTEGAPGYADLTGDHVRAHPCGLSTGASTPTYVALAPSTRRTSPTASRTPRRQDR